MIPVSLICKKHLYLILIIYLIFNTINSYIFADSDRLDKFNFIYYGSVPYVSMVELAETYRVKISYDPYMLSMTAVKNDQTLTLANLSRIAVFNDTPINIMLPARLVRGSMFVPISTFLPLFSRLVKGTLTWDEEKKGIRGSGITNAIKHVTFENFLNGSLIRIKLAEPLKYKINFGENNWLHLTFAEGNFDPDSLNYTAPAGLVLDMRSFQFNADAQLSFLISEEMENYSVSNSPGLDEVLISLHKKRTQSYEAASKTPPNIKSVDPSENIQLWRIDTVIIDPGHGGKDGGAVGPKKTKEKDVVLKVAKELKKIIDKRGEIKGVMTRTNDKYVSLRDRALKARNANGKLFISIHTNASKDKRVKGIEVFFLSAAKTKYAEEVARRENEQALKFEDNNNLDRYASLFKNPNLPKDFKDIEEIHMGMMSSVYLKESQDMCSILLDTAAKATNQRNRGVKQAGFYVMVGTQVDMPSVLFEIGFITNTEEEKLLKRSTYQKRLAQAMYDAIIKFKKKYERGLFSRSE